MQDDFDIVRGKPQAAYGPAVQKSRGFDFNGPTPNAFDHSDQSLQVQVGRQRQS
ncbi:hypothetical protein [Paenarthrobacter nicotinovorans]|uniref:hypothetical protein n=1 Tax=Paenarthrobacter nicotinovorans TaxID=29320 RepID=UPI003DA46520